jgi:hypothetical protein
LQLMSASFRRRVERGAAVEEPHATAKSL